MASSNSNEGDNMQATEDTTYNGWTNYATWGVALVLDNDEGTYNYVRERLAEIREGAEVHSNVLSGIWTEESAIKFDMADFLKDFTEELCGLEAEDIGIPEPSLMAKQVISAGLADVDWDEIANHIISE